MNLETIHLIVGGMHCVSCATNIDLTLEELDGVVDADTNYQKSILRISFDPLKVDLAKVMSEVGKLGYVVKLADEKVAAG